MENVIRVKGEIVAIYNDSGRPMSKTAFPTSGRDVLGYVAQLREKYGEQNVAVDVYGNGHRSRFEISGEFWAADAEDEFKRRRANIRRLEHMIADTDIIECLLGKS